MSAWLHACTYILKKWSTPKFFYEKSGRLLPYVALITLSLLTYGCIAGLLYAPADFQQGDGFRIIYVHVPCAFLSLFIYVLIAVSSLITLVWKIKLADVFSSASAPIGAWFTFLALATGSIWGKPMWGTWWVFDARLTSELILLLLFLGLIALRNAIPFGELAGKAVAILSLVGVVNIPIIHYSVYWWNTLHQGATLNLLGPSLIANSMLYPLLAMLAASMGIFVLLVLIRMRSMILWRERNSQWVRGLITC